MIDFDDREQGLYIFNTNILDQNGNPWTYWCFSDSRVDSAMKMSIAAAHQFPGVNIGKVAVLFIHIGSLEEQLEEFVAAYADDSPTVEVKHEGKKEQVVSISTPEQRAKEAKNELMKKIIAEKNTELLKKERERFTVEERKYLKEKIS